jgi:sugar phosphate isomerase/epimerase
LGKRQFGVSTHLYAGRRLCREHLIEIAAHGFETVELAAAQGHLDYNNPAVVADLQQWLAEAGLVLNSVAAPAAAGVPGDARAPVGVEVDQALFISRRISMKALVVPVGLPREAARTVARLAELAAPLGVTIAVDSRSPSMTPIGSLVHFVEDAGENVGICLDFAGAAQAGDLVDAIEMSAEHLVTTRVPLDGGIDWAATMTTVQKVGYEGAFVFDVLAAGSAKATLARARKVREKMERWLTSI